MRRAKTFVSALLAAVALVACGGGGTDNCPQCNSHCRLPAWPRLVLGIVPGSVDGGAGGIGVELVTDNYTSYWDSIPAEELDRYMEWKRAHIGSDEALALDTAWPEMLRGWRAFPGA